MKQKISDETWEQMKIAYAAGTGLREIARKMNLAEGTVLAHAKRKGWTQQIEVAKRDAKPIQSNAITPLQAMATTLNERKDKSRLHLSKYVADASRTAADSEGDLKIARHVKDVATVHSTIWPEQPQQGNGVLPGLHVFSRQTVINVQERSSN